MCAGSIVRARWSAVQPVSLGRILSGRFINRQANLFYWRPRRAEFLLFQWCERQGAAAGVDSCAMAPLVFGNAAAARMRMRKGSGDAERGGF